MLEEALYAVARHKNHGHTIQIDDLIDKLLASRKFDVLAERIAQKTVESVINIKPYLRVGKDLPIQVNDDVTQNVEFKNVSYKTDIRLEETGASPIKNLSLKFKYFTKGLHYSLNSNNNKEVAGAKHISEPDTKNTTDINTKIEDDIEVEEDTDSLSISDLDSSSQDKADKINDSIKFRHDQKHSNEIKDKKGNETEKDGSLSLENERNAEELAKNELSEEHKKNESHVDGANRDFDDKVRKDRTLFSNESKDESEEPNNNRNKKPIRKRVHREGNRWYTFRSSSDYDEYHQELERVEKERNVFV